MAGQPVAVQSPATNNPGTLVCCGGRRRSKPQRTENTGNGQQAVIDELKVRLWDNRHFLSLPFDERSSGFRWFFSFLAAFSAYRDDPEKKVIILLDEPALGLHARAQKDFLRYVDEQLSPTRQVIYSLRLRPDQPRGECPARIPLEVQYDLKFPEILDLVAYRMRHQKQLGHTR